MLLEGKIAAVTGAGRGIGRSIALRFAREGAQVIAVDINGDAARETASEITGWGRRGIALAVDVRDVAQVQTIVATAVREFGRLDVMVNNAGIAQAKPMLEITEKDWADMFDVNTKGLFFCLQAAARQMIAQNGGKIINIASVAGRLGRPAYTHYAASKAAVISITRSAALDLAPYGITVNALCPGVVDTAMWELLDAQIAATENLPPGEAKRRAAARVPLGRIETPEDVAGVAAFLASADADYMTGQCLNVCGGLVMS